MNKQLIIKQDSSKLFWVFLTGAILGTWYEVILNLILNGTIERRSSLFFGPINLIYGLAFVLAVILLKNVNRSINIVILGSFLGGIIEYYASYIQEMISGSTSWDYSSLFLNIEGRTTLPFMLYWGILVWLAVRKLYPLVLKTVDKVSSRLAYIIQATLIILLAFNIIFSAAVFIRRGLRVNGFEPITPIGAYFDTHFNDETILKYYPNLIID